MLQQLPPVPVLGERRRTDDDLAYLLLFEEVNVRLQQIDRCLPERRDAEVAELAGVPAAEHRQAAASALVGDRVAEVRWVQVADVPPRRAPRCEVGEGSEADRLGRRHAAFPRGLGRSRSRSLQLWEAGLHRSRLWEDTLPRF